MGFLLRRRSLVLKVIGLVGVAWFTVAFLLYTEDRGVNDLVQDEHLRPHHLPQVDVHDKGAAEETKATEKRKEKQPAEEVQGGPMDGQGGVLDPPKEANYGEMGKPVILPANLTKEVKKLVDEGWLKNAFNQYVSDMISVHRTLPDPRDAWCKEPGRYASDKPLPATAVVICFHNEAWSVLLRTVHSVIDRSPPELLKEIILVDDFSDMPHTKDQLETYMAQFPKVRIVRAEKREGLIRARLLGAKYATAPILTYLDSHCECTEGWLEPLVHRIAQEPTAVVCPVIDVIDDTTLEYHWHDSSGVNVGGFDWNLQVNGTTRWASSPEIANDVAIENSLFSFGIQSVVCLSNFVCIHLSKFCKKMDNQRDIKKFSFDQS